MPEPSVVVSPEAEADLQDIFLYIVRGGGVAAASRYDAGIRERIRSLAAMPLRGQDASALRAGSRRMVHLSHIIYYQPVEDGVLVLRVIHSSRDQASALREGE